MVMTLITIMSIYSKISVNSCHNIILLIITDLSIYFLANIQRPPKGGHVVGHTHAQRGCTVFGIIFFSLNLLILLILRPNTLSCTCLTTNRITVSLQVLQTLARL